MGQRLGKAAYVEDVKPFLNLPEKQIYLLWEAFNNIAAGFGLSPEEFTDICLAAELQSVLGMTENRVAAAAAAAFTVFDTDENDLVDALEFLATFALASGMDYAKKIEFAFNCYDFDESGELTVDEMTLSFKSTLLGLAKLTGEEPPSDEKLEELANYAFQKADRNADNKISRQEFRDYCIFEPDVRSWLNFYHDPDDVARVAEETHDPDVSREAAFSSSPRRKSLVGSTGAESRRGSAALSLLKAAAKLDGEWHGIVEELEPQPAPTLRPEAPGGHSLEWIHGYSIGSMRNNLKYTSLHNIVYPAAGVGVTLSKDPYGQKFFVNHTNDISALALHIEKGRNIVATGQVGELRPRVCLWDADTTETLCTIDDFHVGAIIHIAFSPDGRNLVTVGQDRAHMVAVYELEYFDDGRVGVKSKIFSSESSRSKVLGCSFMDNNRFVTCGERHIYFWHRQSREARFVREKGIFGRANDMETLLCVQPHPDASGDVVTGTLSGNLLIWRARNCIKKITSAHSGAVNVIHALAQRGMVSGGKDGTVVIWDTELRKGATFDIVSLGSIDAAVRSIQWDSATHTVLIGTRAAEIFEMADTDGSDINQRPLVAAHSGTGLDGLDVAPEGSEFATGGDDATVRLWDADSHRLLRMATLEAPIKCIAYAPNNKRLALGMGSPDGEGAGVLIVLNKDDLAVIHQSAEATKHLTCLSYSPDGSAIACGSADGTIYIYSTLDDSFTLLCRCQGHAEHVTGTSSIVHVDFDNTGDHIRSNDAAGRLLFHSTIDGSVEQNFLDIRNYQWYSSTCPMCWEVGGCWEAFTNGSAPKLQVLSVDRSPDGKLLAFGDNYGCVATRYFPSPIPTSEIDVAQKQRSHECHGHSTKVSNVKFSKTGVHLLTVGAGDKCIFQWFVEPAPSVVGATKPGQSTDEVVDDDDAPVLERSLTAEEDPTIEIYRAASSRRQRSDQFRLWNGETNFFDLQKKAQAGKQTEEDEDDEGVPEDRERPLISPWLDHCAAPSDPQKSDVLEPLDDLKLDFIHGYSTTMSRNNLFYTADEGVIVYPAAAVGVLYNVPKKVQKFNLSHTDDVTAIAIDPSGLVIASGQLQANDAKISIWDARTGSTLHELKGVHSGGVGHIKFSGDGKLLGSVGLNDTHTFVLHNALDDFRWQGAVELGEGDIYAISFCPEGSRFDFCTAGDKDLRFWKVNGQNFKATQAFLGSEKGTWQPFLCLGAIDSDMVAGTLDGHLYCFRKHRLRSSVKAHQAPILAMDSVSGKGLVSGAADGSIRLWNSDLECFAEFSMSKQVDSIHPSVRSLCWRPAVNRLLVGTGGSEIFELNDKTGADLNKGGAVMNGHYSGEVCGLAVHPTEQEACTVGSDKTVRIWDLVDARLVMQAEMELGMHCCAYSPDAKLIAVGMGVPGVKHKMNGFFMVLKCENLLEVHRGQDTLQYVSDIKFSPDGETLAVGSVDGTIYLYDVHLEWNLRATFTKSLGGIVHFDFDTNSEFIQNSDIANDIYFSNAADGKQIADHTALRDVPWATWTLNVGWPVSGLAQRTTSQPTVNCVSRSKDQMLVVSGDDFGYLRLFNYPCDKEGAQCKAYKGHSCRVSNALFTLNDEYVVSTGGRDLCLFQWKVNFEDPDVGLQNASPLIRDAPLCADVGLSVQEVVQTILTKQAAQEARVSGSGSIAAGDVRPWEKSVVVPTESVVDPSPPEAQLELEFVYGFNGRIARSNVHYNAEGSIVYHAAGVGIIYDKREHQQVFNSGVHDQEITALVIDPTRRYVATAQFGEEPVVQVWDAASGASVAVFENVHHRGVGALSFSPDGKRLASVGIDDDHRLAVFASLSGSWQDGSLVATATAGTKEVLFCTWTKHKDPEAFDLVTGGVNHSRFWRVVPGSRQLAYKSGLFGSASPKTLTCGVSIQETVITGTSTGDLYIWEGRTCVSALAEVHTAGINTICSIDHATFLTGSKDGTVKVWTETLEPKKTIDLTKIQPRPKNPEVRSVNLDPVTNTVLVATASCEIYEFFARGHTQIVQVHFEGEVWGLACNPREHHMFVSTGDDKTIRLWDMERRQLVKKLDADSAMRAAGFSADGTQLVVGFGGAERPGKKEGAFMVLQADGDLTLVHEGRPAKRAITTVGFAPNGKVLALGSADSKLYLHDCRDFDKQAICEAHSQPLKHVDFTLDSKHIQTNCDGHELLFFDTIAGQQITEPSQLKNAEWASQHCVYGWQVQGLWKDAAGLPAAPSVAAVDRSPDGKLLVSADSRGRVVLRRFPCVDEGHGVSVGLGHAAPVTNVRFSSDGKRVLSTGGVDRSVMQWKLV